MGSGSPCHRPVDYHGPVPAGYGFLRLVGGPRVNVNLGRRSHRPAHCHGPAGDQYSLYPEWPVSHWQECRTLYRIPYSGGFSSYLGSPGESLRVRAVGRGRGLPRRRAELGPPLCLWSYRKGCGSVCPGDCCLDAFHGPVHCGGSAVYQGNHTEDPARDWWGSIGASLSSYYSPRGVSAPRDKEKRQRPGE